MSTKIERDSISKTNKHFSISALKIESHHTTLFHKISGSKVFEGEGRGVGGVLGFAWNKSGIGGFLWNKGNFG